MSQFIESFFDKNVPGFKLWNKKIDEEKLKDDEIYYKGKMLKMNRKNQKLKERYFILTQWNLFYLKSQKIPKIRGMLDN